MSMIRSGIDEESAERGPALSRRDLIRATIAYCLAPLSSSPASGQLGLANVNPLSGFRGFNLVDNLVAGSEKGFQEEDFDFLAEFGFNFVRVPVDYRTWTSASFNYDEAKLRQIDQMIEWGRSREIHVNLCLHRVPGYCVAGPVDALDLWAGGRTGDITRKLFVEQWKMLSQRYAHVSSAYLSFNLLNEPPPGYLNIYCDLISEITDIVRQSISSRIIIADGVLGKRMTEPVQQLTRINVAQSLHTYYPTMIARYRWSSLEQHESLPEPSWPAPNRLNGFLYGDAKSSWRKPLKIKHDFHLESSFGITIETVSGPCLLVIKADDRDILRVNLPVGPAGAGDWKFSASIGTQDRTFYQVAYGKRLLANIPAGSQAVSVEIEKGDWISFSSISFSPFPFGSADGLEIHPGLMEKYVVQEEFRLTDSGELITIDGKRDYGKADLWHDEIEPWLTVAGSGGGVHVGEWGITNTAPYQTAISLIKDDVELFRTARFGWAFWYLRGPWGLLDGLRDGVKYEAWRKHRLDSNLLRALKF